MFDFWGAFFDTSRCIFGHFKPLKVQKKPQKVQKKMALYKTFLTVRQEKTIKCPKNCVFWNQFLHQNPGFSGFLCISRAIFAPLRGVFAPFGGIFPHSFARRQGFPNTKFTELERIPCICRGVLFRDRFLRKRGG